MNQPLVWNFEFSIKNPISFSHLVDIEKDQIKWECRFFWPEHETIVLHAFDKNLLDLNQYEHKIKEDDYYLLPHKNYNIKRRRNELLYKPLVDQTEHILGFGSKIHLDDLNDSIPKVDQLRQILFQVKNQATVVHVHKESYVHKCPTTPTTKLELARLEVNGQVYFSACIEGRSLNSVETLSELLLGTYVSCDYVTFLKNIIPS